MSYAVRVTGPNKETKYDEFDVESRNPDTEEFDRVEADARDAYASAVREYDLSHTVTLFRDGVSVGNAVGTGAGSLPDAEPEDPADTARPAVVEGNGSLLRAQGEERKSDEVSSEAERADRVEGTEEDSHTVTEYDQSYRNGS